VCVRNGSDYASTRPHLLINKDTKVITQGFTGKQVRFSAMTATHA
jgi:succinyl-CoA synthetase alpha subunit